MLVHCRSLNWLLVVLLVGTADGSSTAEYRESPRSQDCPQYAAFSEYLDNPTKWSQYSEAESKQHIGQLGGLLKAILDNAKDDGKAMNKRIQQGCISLYMDFVSAYIFSNSALRLPQILDITDRSHAKTIGPLAPLSLLQLSETDQFSPVVNLAYVSLEQIFGISQAYDKLLINSFDECESVLLQTSKDYLALCDSVREGKRKIGIAEAQIKRLVYINRNIKPPESAKKGIESLGRPVEDWEGRVDMFGRAKPPKFQEPPKPTNQYARKMVYFNTHKPEVDSTVESKTRYSQFARSRTQLEIERYKRELDQLSKAYETNIGRIYKMRKKAVKLSNAYNQSLIIISGSYETLKLKFFDPEANLVTHALDLIASPTTRDRIAARCLLEFYLNYKKATSDHQSHMTSSSSTFSRAFLNVIDAISLRYLDLDLIPFGFEHLALMLSTYYTPTDEVCTLSLVKLYCQLMLNVLNSKWISTIDTVWAKSFIMFITKSQSFASNPQNNLLHRKILKETEEAISKATKICWFEKKAIGFQKIGYSTISDQILLHEPSAQPSKILLYCSHHLFKNAGQEKRINWCKSAVEELCILGPAECDIPKHVPILAALKRVTPNELMRGLMIKDQLELANIIEATFHGQLENHLNSKDVDDRYKRYIEQELFDFKQGIAQLVKDLYSEMVQ